MFDNKKIQKWIKNDEFVRVNYLGYMNSRDMTSRDMTSRDMTSRDTTDT